MRKDTNYYGFITKGGIQEDISKKVVFDLDLKELTSFVNSEVRVYLL